MENNKIPEDFTPDICIFNDAGETKYLLCQPGDAEKLVLDREHAHTMKSLSIKEVQELRKNETFVIKNRSVGISTAEIGMSYMMHDAFTKLHTCEIKDTLEEKKSFVIEAHPDYSPIDSEINNRTARRKREREQKKKDKKK